MSRALPAQMNCVTMTNPRISLSGTTYTVVQFYSCCVRYQVNGAWQIGPVPWMQQGSGQVSASAPESTSLATLQQSLISAAAAAEGLTTGDFVVLPDGTVVTL